MFPPGPQMELPSLYFLPQFSCHHNVLCGIVGMVWSRWITNIAVKFVDNADVVATTDWGLQLNVSYHSFLIA